MSLRKSPTRTPAFLAACRANGRKSRGPSTPAGKSRSRLNHLQHGRYCRVLHRLLPEGLSFSERLRYNWIRRAIEHCFRPETARKREWALRLAIEVWCQVAGREKKGISGNVAENRPVRDERRLLRIRCRIKCQDAKHSLTFWTQRRGQRPRLKVGDTRARTQTLFAGWYGPGGVQDWGPEPLPNPERDPMGLWHWMRDMRRQFRALRRSQAREARREQAWETHTADLAARYQATSQRPALPAVAASSPLPIFSNSPPAIMTVEGSRICTNAAR